MKVLSRFQILASICMVFCIIEYSNAEPQYPCTGTEQQCNVCDGKKTQSSCEQASSYCVWSSTHICSSTTNNGNGGCFGMSKSSCGNTFSGSNSRWCFWGDPGTGTRSCLTSDTANSESWES